MLPEAQALEGNETPLRGAANLRLSRKSTLPQKAWPSGPKTVSGSISFFSLRAARVMTAASPFLKPVLRLLVLPVFSEPNGQAPSVFSCERLGVCYAR